MATDAKSPTIVTVVGLPGSGKTGLVRRLSLLLPGLFVADDFHRSATGVLPQQSPQFAGVVAAADRGQEVVVSDIRYCDARELDRFKSAISARVPSASQAVIYFENDVAQCLANVARRGRASAETEAARARELTQMYRPGTEAIPVYQGGESEHLLASRALKIAAKLRPVGDGGAHLGPGV